ncbi:MAG: hypothetical protein E6H07_00190 [Bacteroidetes bacterium]|nr:MAG: hypothetical protein E6H07_00190 [Bacteroidota bacterium]
MRKLLFIAFIILFGVSIKTSGQKESRSQVGDALFIRNKCFSEDDGLFKNREDLFAVLKYYYPGINLSTTEIKKNPFFKEFTPEIVPQSIVGSIFSGALSSIGSADVTQFADGLAKFLVKRTKEELSAAFFNQFKEDLNSDKYSDLRILFPQTARLLNLIDEKIYQFSAYLTELREAFIIDLNSIPSSALVVINLPKYNDYFKKHPEFKKAFQTGLFLSNLILQKDSLRHIGNIVEAMPIDQYFSLGNKTTYDTAINGGLKTLQLLSNSLRSLDTTGTASKTQRYWVSADSLFMMLNDLITFKIYLGLVYQEAIKKNICYPTKVTLIRLLDEAAGQIAKIEEIKNTLTDFYAAVNAYDDYKKQWSNIKLGFQKDSIRLYTYGLFTSSFSIIEMGLQLPFKFSKKTVSAVTNTFIPILKDAGDIFMYVNQKKYGPATLSLVKLYKDIFHDADQEEKKEFGMVKLIAHLSTYGSFISQVAKAESSDQVADIIAKTVLPTGSSYIKKHSVFNIALQAYTGFYGGQQRQATDSTKISAAGVYAPVGISLSWGSKTHKRNGDKKDPSSFSAFFSIIDVGSLVSYRFSNTNDSLANDIEIRLNQILAPGLHLVYGFPKWPISFGIGANWTPLLTKVETNAISVLNIDTRPFRWQAFLAVDIPFLNFYNKPR